MSVLSDRDIKRHHKTGKFSITPFDFDRIQPASYDVALADKFRVFKDDEDNRQALDPINLPEYFTDLVDCSDFGFFVLEPGQFVLGMTIEKIRLDDSVVARVEGKSSLGRLGLVVHSTAGWIDPGFNGTITLEMTNLSPRDLILTPGMLIAQIAFMTLSITCEKPYGSPGLKSRYQNDTSPAQSRGVS